MSEFLDMGGYAFFVWGSYVAMAVVFAWNLLSVRAQRRDFERRMREAEVGEDPR